MAKTGDTKNYKIDLPIADITSIATDVSGASSIVFSKEAIAKAVAAQLGSKFIPIVNAIALAAFVASATCKATDTKGLKIKLIIIYKGIDYIGPGGSYTTEHEQWQIKDTEFNFY